MWNNNNNDNKRVSYVLNCFESAGKVDKRLIIVRNKNWNLFSKNTNNLFSSSTSAFASYLKKLEPFLLFRFAFGFDEVVDLLTPPPAPPTGFRLPDLSAANADFFLPILFFIVALVPLTENVPPLPFRFSINTLRTLRQSTIISSANCNVIIFDSPSSKSTRKAVTLYLVLK